ncbi:hypothetical protein A5886_001653 [Enterococcus sp. 8G7_MSG3316]|uniref:Uncharacterized protein n=1 Tax=Candidatus Enterococcus testudinis TaxID=1834191 RepID=A0A242A6B2_9ENTE|nr:hypothetical protein [Enterococcus sp. 8G7_MSG3316]OTN76576.1 hypothetical protein A5886_001653 [Enterococcus sp. 8G7_MSG3316]
MRMDNSHVLVKVLAGLVWLIANGIALVEKGLYTTGISQKRQDVCTSEWIDEDGQEFTVMHR